MRVKHLIKELQKCDPEKGVYTQDTRAVLAADTQFIMVDDEGNIRIMGSWLEDSGEPYDNLEDTPRPLPESPIWHCPYCGAASENAYLVWVLQAKS